MLESFIHITRECNNDCIFCGFPKENFFLDFVSIKEKLSYAKKNGSKLITLTGGEPLTHPNIQKILHLIRELGVESRIITNGTYFTEKLLISLKQSGLNYLAVSLHTLKKEKAKLVAGNSEYDVGHVVSLIKFAIKLGLPVYLNTTIFRLNYKELPDVARFISNYISGIHLVNLNYVNLQGNAAKSEHEKRVSVTISEVELYLYEAMRILSSSKINFRVERVPLCYMVGFERYSSEYNRVMKIEKPNVDMIDGHYIETADFFGEYNKSDSCKLCSRDKFCLGLHTNYVKKHGLDELYPIFD